MTQSHKGEILALKNQIIPISRSTAFHAKYDNDLYGFNQGQKVSPFGYTTTLKFNGSESDYINIPLSSLPASLSSITIEFWANPTSGPVGGNTAIQAVPDDTSNRINIHFPHANGYLYWDFGNIAALPARLQFTWDLTWYDVMAHWAFVVENGVGMRAYRNGVLIGNIATNSTFNMTGKSLYVGRDYSVGSYWKGVISDLRIWTVARTQQQIIYNMNSELNGDEYMLAGFWKLNETSGPVVYDSSMNGNDGVVNGNPIKSEGRIVATLRPEGKFGGSVAVEEPTTNYYSGQTPWANNGGVNYDVTDQYSASSPVPSAKTWKLVKTGPASQWNGWEGAYADFGGQLNIGDWVSVSGYYKSSTNIGVSSFDFKLYTQDWARQVSTSAAYPIIYDGAWHRFSLSVQVTEAILTPILADAVSWSYSTLAGEMLINGLQWERKPFSTSFVNGSRGSGTLKYSDSLINPSQGTVSFWYNPAFPMSLNTSQGVSPVMFQAGYYYYNSSFTIWNYMKNFNVYFKGLTSSGWSGNASVLIGSAFPENTWRMVTVTWNGLVWKLYMDGVYQGGFIATEAMGPIAGNVISIGGHIYFDGTSGNQCNGLLDDFRIDIVEISADEILAWYQSNKPFYSNFDRSGVAY